MAGNNDDLDQGISRLTKAMLAHVASMPTEEENASFCRRHLEIAAPTYLENWPAELKRLSIAQTYFAISPEESQAMMDAIDERATEAQIRVLKAMAAHIDTRLPIFPRGAFVRLGSRSPKDAFYTDSMQVTSGEKAMQLLCTSMRVFEDLHLAKQASYTPQLFLREWKDIPEWTEFRCFMKDRQLVGISQYYYRQVFPEIAQYRDSIHWAITQFFTKLFKPASHLNDVVFDVFLSVYQSEQTVRIDVKLLEINPFSPMTDPCLFAWDEPEGFQGQLRIATGRDEEEAS